MRVEQTPSNTIGEYQGLNSPVPDTEQQHDLVRIRFVPTRLITNLSLKQMLAAAAGNEVDESAEQ